MKKFFAEFKKFITRGNVMDMAVGVIVGGAFTAIVNALVEDILNPLIALLGGDALVDGASALSYTFANGVTMNYGNFIGAIINFLILAVVVFFIVKGINVLTELGKKKEEEAPAEPPAPPAPSAEEVLLTEIRDLLKEKK